MSLCDKLLCVDLYLLSRQCQIHNPLEILVGNFQLQHRYFGPIVLGVKFGFHHANLIGWIFSRILNTQKECYSQGFRPHPRLIHIWSDGRQEVPLLLRLRHIWKGGDRQMLPTLQCLSLGLLCRIGFVFYCLSEHSKA